MPWEIRNNCRLCEGYVDTKLRLEPTPVANNFQTEPNKGEMYPLELCECSQCGHVQNSIYIHNLYDGYKYRTPSANKSRLIEFAKKLKERYPSALNVVEIGANNGLFTYILGDHFKSVIGVDPAGEFPVWGMGFNVDTAKMILGKFLPDLVVANNVFAHVDDLDGIWKGIELFQCPVVFEVQNFTRMVDGGIYDTIYHEHLDQHTFTPWLIFLSRYGYKVDKVESIPEHGGSMRVYCSPGRIAEGYHFIQNRVDWAMYDAKIRANQDKLLNKLPEKFSIWGATAKATTLIHQLGIKDRVLYCVDNTPVKQGLYLPGTEIQIIKEFIDNSVVLLTAWNFEKEFVNQYPNREYITPYE